jgi:choline dehydrogenase-like flavoprotein
MAESYDVVIVGSGAGGATAAYAFARAGVRTLLLERGDFLPQEDQNWDAKEIFEQGRYKTKELWIDGKSTKEFRPGMHYFVGGNTKVFGASLPRFRVSDFAAIEHGEGTSPAWPFSYIDLEPYYAQAEKLYLVHGSSDKDATDPPRSAPFPFPPIPHEPYVFRLAERLKRLGYSPADLPIGIDLRANGRCIRCGTCDGFPCKLYAKADADISCVRPAVATGNLILKTRSFVRRLIADAKGRRIEAAEIEKDGHIERIQGQLFVVSCGAVNSAALLLRSTTGNQHGLANRNGLVGRHYMVHNNTIMLSVDPWRTNRTVFQKTLYVNDFYLKGNSKHPFPLGHIQLIGKVQAAMLKPQAPSVPRFFLEQIAHRSADWWLFSEDLPDPENRVTVDSQGRISIHWTPNNLTAHRELVQEARNMVSRAGFSIKLTRQTGIEVNSHQAGTLRAGADPASSILDPFCKAHEVDNLYVIDSSFFPSLPVMNPALTIAANALRVVNHILETGQHGNLKSFASLKQTS